MSNAVDTKHFPPYIVESEFKKRILTDSKPCVQSFEKLPWRVFCQPESVYISLHYQAPGRHLSGTASIRTYIASRNASECTRPTCQVCSFVQLREDSVDYRPSVEGMRNYPSWLAFQAECPDIRCIHAHLTQDTRPLKNRAL